MKYYVIKNNEGLYWSGNRYYPKWIYGIDGDCFYDDADEAREEIETFGSNLQIRCKIVGVSLIEDN